MSRLVHISDPHCGSPHFVTDLMSAAVLEIADLDPDAVICSGDLTSDGFRHEYEQAHEFLARFDCPLVIVPGNHDSRNVGFLHFEELFGERNPAVTIDGIRIVGIDSSEPDLDHGRVGRGRYGWILEQFAEPARFCIFVLHHHLLPVPGTGRERNVIYDAGDAIEVLQHAGVNLVLSGHKHVPYAWRLENLFIVNAGTVSSLRLRGNTRPCYNLIEVDDGNVTVWRMYPRGQRERMIDFAVDTLEFRKYTQKIEGEVTSY